MPRRPRIHLPDQPLHIVQRGHNRDACFFAENDYLAYREWLGEALKEQKGPGSHGATLSRWNVDGHKKKKAESPAC